MSRLRKFIEALAGSNSEKPQWAPKTEKDIGISSSSITFEELTIEKAQWRELLETYETHTILSYFNE